MRASWWGVKKLLDDINLFWMTCTHSYIKLISSLAFSVLNKFSWKVYDKSSADTLVEQSHSFPLSPGLIPIARFQTAYRRFLGFPFTKCKAANPVNSYTEWKFASSASLKEIYKKRFDKKLLNTIFIIFFAVIVWWKRCFWKSSSIADAI